MSNLQPFLSLLFYITGFAIWAAGGIFIIIRIASFGALAYLRHVDTFAAFAAFYAKEWRHKNNKVDKSMDRPYLNVYPDNICFHETLEDAIEEETYGLIGRFKIADEYIANLIKGDTHDTAK